MERGNTAVIVVVIFTAAIIMFIGPLMIIANTKDKAAQLAVQEAVTEWVNEVTTKGKLTQEDYDNLQLKLAATGEAYNIEITVAKLDENTAKKITGDLTINGGQYINLYTTQVLESLPMELNPGDLLSVKANMISSSISQQLTNWLYRATGKDNNVAQASSMV